jgi:hypothetical protein
LGKVDIVCVFDIKSVRSPTVHIWDAHQESEFG